MEYQNHLIDPTFFYDVIEEFSFDYNVYSLKGDDIINDYGERQHNYTKSIIRGSLQSKGKQLSQSKSGNTETVNYDFYCKSLYRLDIGDLIEYKNNYLRVISIQDYDEFGVREASLEMIKLAAYRDFADYLKYINGEKIV